MTAGDKVVVLRTNRKGPKGSGRLVDFRWVHVFMFRNGRIVAFEERADVNQLVSEFRGSQVHASFMLETTDTVRFTTGC